MSFFAHDDLLDNGPNYLKNNCNLVTVCSAYPTTYTEALTTYKLADVSVSSSDFSVSNGVVSGRRVILASKSGVPVDASGTITHIAFLDTLNLKILLVSETTSQVVSSGGNITIASMFYEFRDPVAT